MSEVENILVTSHSALARELWCPPGSVSQGFSGVISLAPRRNAVGQRFASLRITRPDTAYELSELRDMESRERSSAILVPRTPALENWARFRQWVTYNVVMHAPAGREPWVLTYRRSKQSGEQRLLDLLAIGIGGHVSQEDAQNAWSPTFGRAYVETACAMAAARELCEEIGVDVAAARTERELAQLLPTFLVQHSDTPLARVHIGAGVVVRLDQTWKTAERVGDTIQDRQLLHAEGVIPDGDDRRLLRFNEELAEPQWLTLDELAANLSSMEVWSQLLTRWLIGQHYYNTCSSAD